MKRIFCLQWRPLLWRMVPALLLGCSATAQAALGGDLSSVGQDRVHIKATVRTQPAAATPGSFSVTELVTPEGVTVREFLTAGGKVFAVTWAGPAVPDLRQLLGPYFADYASSTTPTGHRGHSHRTVMRDDLVVRSSGRMRAFSGTAYVPSLVPTGVAINDLQ